jgi:hypothetical protein
MANDFSWIEPGTDNDRFTCLVIGRSGIGKTYLMHTIPGDEPVFVISAESGLLCVQDIVRSGQVSGIKVTNMAQVLDAMRCLRDPSWQEAYKWVFVDSLTEISYRWADACKLANAKSLNKYKVWDDYEEGMKKVILGFRDLPHYHVVMTCLEKVDVDEGKSKYVSADVQMERLRSHLPSYFDEVFYMTDEPDPKRKGGSRRILRTQPDNYLPGKDRSGRLEPVEEPDLALIRAKIMEG